MHITNESTPTAVPRVIYDVSVRRMGIPYEVTVDAKKIANVLFSKGVSEQVIGMLAINIEHDDPEEDSCFEFDLKTTAVTVFCQSVWEEFSPDVDKASKELNANFLYVLSHVIDYTNGKNSIWYALANITGLFDPILYRLDPTERNAASFLKKNRENPEMGGLIRIGFRD